MTAPPQLEEPSQRPAAARLTLSRRLFLPLNPRRAEVIENAPPPVQRKRDEESRTDFFFFYLVFLGCGVSGGAIKGPLPLKENDTRLSHRIKPDVR